MTRKQGPDAQRGLILDVLRGRLTLSAAARQAAVSPDTVRRAKQRYLESKLPTGGTVTTGVRSPVRILRDAGWVPHIHAETSRDLFFGHGFAMAQDRLWQMDYLRRRAFGRLAEVLGAEAVGSDRRHRILGFGRYAEHELGGISDEAGEALEGFAAGINAWIEQVRANLPIEFEILEYEPEPWAPRDSLATLRTYYWHLTGRLENLAAGEAASRFLGEQLAADFLRTEFPDETILPGDPARAPGGLIQAGASGGGDGDGGSNNWAVAPSRSASGRAMLATDPHVPFTLPGGYYQAHLHGAGYDVAGAGNAGAPGLKFGHNERIAWGITNLVASARDLYLETLNPDNPGQYRADGGWADLETRVEQIKVRGAAPIQLELRSTPRGPLVDELVPSLGPPNGTALSLRWVGQERLGDVQAVLDLDRARDWASFRRAASGWRLPVFNLVYADVDGHIGWQAVGSIPIRGASDTSRGYRTAGDPAHEWCGYLAFDDLPRLEDPPRGWIATANNRPVGDDFGPPLYGWWAPGQRAVRLRRIFEAQERFSLDDFRRVHFDTFSVRAEQLVPRLRALLEEQQVEAARRLGRLLDGWDYRYTPDSVPATVFETFFELWVERVVAARFPTEVRGVLLGLGAGSGLAGRLITEGRPTGWFQAGTIGSQVASVASAALADLERRLGPESGGWTWGRLHRVSFRHPLDGRPGTRGLFATPPRPAPGTSHVLNNNGFGHGRRFDVTGGPEFRMVVDFGDLDATETVLTTGQSGQPGGPNYSNMTEKWLKGQYFSLPFTRAAVEAAAVGEVQLKPHPE